MNNQQPVQISRETLLQVHATALKIDQHICTVRETSQRIAKQTLFIIRTVLFLLLISTIITFGMLFHLSGKMRQVIGNMVEMYERFDVMSKDMNKITTAVINMGDNTQGIPEIAVSMNRMTDNVVNMRGNVGRMTANIVQMDDNMVSISGNVQSMADRFDHLTHTVHGMRYNVKQMSGPIRSAPWPFPFP